MASVEAGLLQVSAPDPADHRRTLVAVANACLMSALIIHLHASFISFVGAFFLVRFKVQEARREENKIEGLHPDATQPSKGSIVLDMAAKHITNSPETGSQTSNPHADIQPPVWSANPQLVQVGPFFRQPPMHLLSRCHFLCILAVVFGFALAISGILCLAWARQPLGVKTAVASVLALCLTSGFVVVFSNYDGSPFVYD
ncbi:hypothetical protein E1B28_010185 [Marasmius oreades]|uniref:Transmembrane protein n=1 Tax=Marasmius oreades TaxID=181124 RepID=A0A9P7RXT1_9AGAR|nr:uncharacterized protein E1B28_010185 [Marasmius oreades]KAG7091131.1 hypothetical protein E1B28_010185 [Marasmius oreades]